MDESAHHELSCLIECCFTQPIAEHRWAAIKTKRLWVELDQLYFDPLVGPLTEIASSGNCDYLFSHPDQLDGIMDADDFALWAREALEQARSQVHEFRPRGKGQSEDYGTMLELIDEMGEAVELAITLQFQHAEAERGAKPQR